MSRKKYTKPKITSICLEEDDFKWVLEHEGNFSEWVSKKIREQRAGVIIGEASKVEKELAEISAQEEQAKIDTKAREKKAEELKLKMDLINNPSQTLAQLQKERYEKAMEVIRANLGDPEKAKEKAEIWKDILLSVGKEVNIDKLLRDAENNKMYR